MARPASSVTHNETPVLVYDSPEFKQLSKLSEGRNNFENGLSSTDHKAKTFSLLPFLVEAAFTPKSFVLRMQLYPKASLLQLDTL